MPKYDNSHLCGLCTGAGMEGDGEVCKPCKGTGIEPQYWAREIVKLQSDNYLLKDLLGKCNYTHLDSRIVTVINKILG